MPTPLRRRLRIARRSLAYSAAIVLVLVAVLLGAVSQVLPLAERHPERVARWLSERAGRPVAFDRMQTEWTRRGPLLKLDGLRIGEGARAFEVGDTEMLVSVYAGLLPGYAFSELRLRGLDLTLERAADGRWQVRGLPGQQQADGDPLAALEGLGELQVIGGKLAVSAPSSGVHAQLPKVHLRLRVDGDRVRAGVRAWARTDASPVDVVLDFDRRKGDGRAYAVARSADLAAWTSLLRSHGMIVEGGRGRAEAWADLRGHRVESVTLAALLEDVALRGAPIAPGTVVPRSRFDHVQGFARWQLLPSGWRVDAPLLRIDSGAREQKLDGLLVAGGEQYALQAAQVDAGPLFAVLALSDRLQPGLRNWLLTSRPVAALRDVELAGRRGGAVRVRADVAGLGFGAVGKSPGLQGLGGTLEGDGSGFRFELDPAATLRFDWPGGFGVAHDVKLRGEVTGWREGNGWRIGTPALRIDGKDLGVGARGDLWWQGDGTRPRIDLAAEIDDTAIPVAKGFWLRASMSPITVRWLDTALVAGRLQQGRAIISGDLDDWPFRNGAGVFEATGQVRDATIRFQEEWPPAHVDVDARFTGIGFDVEGTGKLGAVGIKSIHAGIDDYRDGALTVRAAGEGDAAHLLDVLRQSPLRRDHADTFANVRASGPAGVTFGLNLPLRKGATTAIDGSVALKNARLADARWKLAFEQVNGTAAYSRSGFRAENLAVRHEGEPGTLSLRAGSRFVRDTRNVFEAGLEARLGTADLVGRVEGLAWLKPHVRGRSAWTVGLAIRKAAAGTSAPTLLQLSSNLAGTALDLPAPLRKPADAALPTRVETPLPLGSGDVFVGLGDVMALRARSANGQTGVRIALGAGRVDEPPPASGLIASGRAASLEVIDWIALTRGGEGGEDKVPPQRIDVTAQRLQLLGGSFPQTRVVVVPAARGATAVQADGPALQGAVLVPAGEGEPIAGRFQRVHWRGLKPDATKADAAKPNAAKLDLPAPTANTVDGNAPADDIDPSRIPALNFDIDDLRIIDAQLGSAKVRTRPTAAGMRIEQLQTRTGTQRIDLSGDWNGRGATTTTRMKLEIGSDDFGALLAGFGVPGRLDSGEGTVRFDAGWPGSPMAFKPEHLDGSLQLDARDGRLLELEPGAGRVLGLLGLAQLPRRLTLDFRDFFSKGFAFDEIKGTVQFGGGHARSNGMVIEGPAATIDIRGAADLRAQSYDQTIEVRPKAANLLTAIGAVAGGPVGAAIGAAANVVLNKPIGSLAAKTYRVTGPWKEPKVEVISREQGRASVAPDDPPG